MVFVRVTEAAKLLEKIDIVKNSIVWSVKAITLSLTESFQFRFIHLKWALIWSVRSKPNNRVTIKRVKLVLNSINLTLNAVTNQISTYEFKSILKCKEVFISINWLKADFYWESI